MNKKQLEQEQNELNTLINKGITFEVEDYFVEEKKKLFGLIKKRTAVKTMRQFKIEEPTLATLDRISAESIEFAIDEEALKSDDGLQKAKTLVKENSRRCSKIIAIAVIGSDYLIPKIGKGGVVSYVEDTKQLDLLTDLFFRQIKPSVMYQLFVLINAMSNLGDFLNSIRLMTAARTTMPIRIEKGKKG